MIVTVLGPISPEQLGVTDAHDHLFLRSPALPGQDFEDTDRAVEEVTNAAGGGLHAIVEGAPIGLGPRPAKMGAGAEATGGPVVAGTGLHPPAPLPEGDWGGTPPIQPLAGRVPA